MSYQTVAVATGNTVTISDTIGVYTLTATGNATIAVTNVQVVGIVNTFNLYLTNGGGDGTSYWTTSFMSNTAWAGGFVPTLSSPGLDVLTFVSIDAGTTWQGFYSVGMQ